MSARPGTVTAVALTVLAAGALGNLAKNGTLDFTETFRSEPESVRALALIQDEFGPGRAAPVDLVVATQSAPEVIAALDGERAVASTTMVSHSRDSRYTLVSVELRLTRSPTPRPPRSRACARSQAARPTAAMRCSAA